jgi:hypothetical protein
MHSPVPLGEQREPKQPPFLRPAPTLRYALGVPTVLFQKVRHGSQVTPVEVAGSVPVEVQGAEGDGTDPQREREYGARPGRPDALQEGLPALHDDVVPIVQVRNEARPLAQGELQVLDPPGTSSVAHTTPPVARARHHGDAGTGDFQRLHAELGEPPGLPAAPGGASADSRAQVLGVPRARRSGAVTAAS